MDTLLEFWFHPNNKKKWFAGDKYDDEILQKFGNLLSSQPIQPNPENYEINKYIELILIFDQLSRHYDRQHGTNKKDELSPCAIELCLYIMDNHYQDFLHISPAKQCFILLPLRHCRKIDSVKGNIRELYRLMERYMELDNSTVWKQTQNIIEDWYGFGCYLIGKNDDYYYNQQRIGKKIPNVYLNSYKASLECLAEIQTPIYYPIDTSTPFPNWKGLLDEKCCFLKDNGIDYTVSIPTNWEKEFIETLPKDKSQKLLLSISGGGDSMTCSILLKRLGYDFACVMINYGNRDSCTAEVQMVHWWCSQLGVNLYVQHIDSINRSRQSCIRDIYEKVTRKMRFNAYKKAGQMFGMNQVCVVLGHNKDDSFENIISNLCKRRSMYNLKAVRPSHFEDGVRIFRPIRNIAKKNITQFLEMSNGPYLYDSTPKWSFRGRTRDNLVPALNQFDINLIGGIEEMANKMYNMSNRYFNILKTQTQFKEDEVKLQVHKQRPKIKIKVIRVNLFDEVKDDEAYWQFIFEHIMFNYEYPMVGNKTIKGLIQKIEITKDEEIKYCLVRNMECRIGNQSMIVYLRPSKD